MPVQVCTITATGLVMFVSCDTLTGLVCRGTGPKMRGCRTPCWGMEIHMGVRTLTPLLAAVLHLQEALQVRQKHCWNRCAHNSPLVCFVY